MTLRFLVWRISVWWGLPHAHVYKSARWPWEPKPKALPPGKGIDWRTAEALMAASFGKAIGDELYRPNVLYSAFDTPESRAADAARRRERERRRQRGVKARIRNVRADRRHTARERPLRHLRFVELSL